MLELDLSDNLDAMAKPLFQFVPPVHGEINLLAVSKARNLALIVIEDAIIVLEYSTTSARYQDAVGHENGHIVTYYTDHRPNTLISLSLNERNFELFAIESRGNLHHLRFEKVLKPISGSPNS